MQTKPSYSKSCVYCQHTPGYKPDGSRCYGSGSEFESRYGWITHNPYKGKHKRIKLNQQFNYEIRWNLGLKSNGCELEDFVHTTSSQKLVKAFIRKLHPEAHNIRVFINITSKYMEEWER